MEESRAIPCGTVGQLISRDDHDRTLVQKAVDNTIGVPAAPFSIDDQLHCKVCSETYALREARVYSVHRPEAKGGWWQQLRCRNHRCTGRGSSSLHVVSADELLASGMGGAAVASGQMSKDDPGPG